VTLDGLGATARMSAGVRWPWAGWLFFAAAAAGWWATFRRDRRWALYGLALVLGHAAGILLLGPFAIADPVVLSRYLIPALPFLLAWVSRCPPPVPHLRPAWPALLLAGAVTAGPLADSAFWRSSLLHTPRYVGFALPRPTLQEHELPPIYRELAAAPRQPVVEAPWQWLSRFGELVGAYQEVHGQRVLVAGGLPRWGAAVRLQNHVPLRPAALLATPARWLVLHAQPRREVRRSFAAADADSAATRRLATAAAAAERRLTAEWGPPHQRSRGIAAWDLDRVRTRKAALRRAP
jgi:hypothetical protein